MVSGDARGDYTLLTFHKLEYTQSLLDQLQRHHSTVLGMKDFYAKVMHNGIKETFTEVQPRYWIMWGRQFVQKLLIECRICKHCTWRERKLASQSLKESLGAQRLSQMKSHLDQRRAFHSISLHPDSSFFTSSGAFLTFHQYRFAHKARFAWGLHG